MKKALLIGALLLMIGGSVVSGTMARYTQELGEKTATVKTKAFNVNSNLDDEFVDIEINPFSNKEEEKFEFEVINYDNIGKDKSPSEVDLNVTFVLEIIDKNKEKQNKKNELLKTLKIEAKSNHFNLKKDKSQNEINSKEGIIEGIASFNAGIPEKKTFNINVKWDNDKIKKLKDKVLDDEIGLRLKINAVQR